MPSLREVAFKRCCMQAFTLFSSFQGDSLFCIHLSNVYARFSPFQTIMLKIYCMQYLLLLPEIVFPDMLKISVNTECIVYSITSCVWCPSSLFERWRGHRGRLTLQWLFISGGGEGVRCKSKKDKLELTYKDLLSVNTFQGFDWIKKPLMTVYCYDKNRLLKI